jgi:hypothetical protein
MIFGVGYDMCYFLAEPRFVSRLPSSEAKGSRLTGRQSLIPAQYNAKWSCIGRLLPWERESAKGFLTDIRVNYFITCIAINLMLSVHFALNPLTLREWPLVKRMFQAKSVGLERWYIGISLFLAFFVPIVPAALGHFGADPVYDAWYVTVLTYR